MITLYEKELIMNRCLCIGSLTANRLKRLFLMKKTQVNGDCQDRKSK